MSSVDYTVFSKRLEPVLTRLAKACLVERPNDIERFCYDFLGKRIGARSNRRNQQLSQSKVVDDPDELEEDWGAANMELRNSRKPPAAGPRYHSTDESSQGSEELRYLESMLGDEEDAKPSPREKVITMEDTNHAQVDQSMFSQAGLSKEALEAEVSKYEKDQRMKMLFDKWDGDGSGAVDLVELVVELHKFDEVARDGKGIQFASDALVQCVNSDKGEIELAEFTKVIVLFCRNIFKKEFDDVAEHMLAVAMATSEEAARQAASGKDTREIEAADKEEEEFLRETVKGIEEHVNDNIRRIRTTRVRIQSHE